MIDFSRSLALLGEDGLQRLHDLRVAVIGIGGVGSWCAEALVRTGVGHIFLMDDDLVAPSNINRQCPATSKTIGEKKVNVMAERLREINPSCDVIAAAERFTSFAACAPLSTVDIIVDAIDSVDCKAELILGATAAGIPIVSSLGAALRLDPTKVSVVRFDKVQGDGLARALRQRFKRLGRYPTAKFDCVVSTEQSLTSPIRGSLMPVTCTFGMTLAAHVITLGVHT